MYHPVMRPGVQHQLKTIGEADLVIGLPSFKNTAAAARVTQVVLKGIHAYYPDLRTVVINADAGFEATTRRAVAAQFSTNGHQCKIVTGRYQGVRGQGSATAALLDAALALDAKAIIILDTNTHSITPNWIAGLAHLILDNKADLVVPRYQWSMPDGALSDLIVYPLFRALWGQSLRHPAAPDFALSPQLANAVLDEDIWETEVATDGFPPWLTTYGVLGKWRVAQSALGIKQPRPKSIPVPGTSKWNGNTKYSFKSQFQNILSVFLRCAYLYEEQWDKINDFRSCSTLTQFTDNTNPNLVFTEREATPLLDNLALGWIEYRKLWQRILTPKNLTQIEALAALPPDRFYFPPDLWARIIYDFVVVFNKGFCDPYQVVEALFPLYEGRLAAFWQEIAGLALVGCEGTVAAQAVEFEELRSYLKIRWETYEPWPPGD